MVFCESDLDNNPEDVKKFEKNPQDIIVYK